MAVSEFKEGELLREATDKDVVNLARYYHHDTVRVGSHDDEIQGNSQTRKLNAASRQNWTPHLAEWSMQQHRWVEAVLQLQGRAIAA